MIVNTPQGPDPFFDEKAIRRAAAEGISALQRGEVNVKALQHLHAERTSKTLSS